MEETSKMFGTFSINTRSNDFSLAACSSGGSSSGSDGAKIYHCNRCCNLLRHFEFEDESGNRVGIDMDLLKSDC